MRNLESVPKETPTPVVGCCPAGVWRTGHRKHASTIGVPNTHGRAKPLPLHCPVDGGAGDAEQVGELSGGVLPRTTQSHQVRFLPVIAGNLHHSGGCAVGSTTSAARNSFATTSTTGTIASGMTNAQRR